MDWFHICVVFVKTYYQFIALGFSLVIFILDIVILGVKNRQPLLTITSSIREWLPVLVKSGENTGLKGVEKLNWVTNKVLELINKYYPKVNQLKYVNVIHILIEELLSTPQKKGD